ncbi:MAG: hypothetical protein IT514_01515 [Burkholderiales bacterium]|nr:hypothetical protein [Burkholderiales bacterium]
MVRRIGRLYAQLLVTGGQLVLVVVGFQIDSRPGWIGTFSLVGLISLMAWAGAFRRHRTIADTPTSRVASAAQGFAELYGRAANLPGTPTRSPASAKVCVWYRYVVEKRESERWREVERDECDFSFLLDDGTGRCVVDPVGAEIHSSRKDTWESGDYRTTEWTILEGEPVYAIGEFHSSHPVEDQRALRTAVSGTLDAWKKDQATLLERFDRDGDGRIDLAEWEAARRAAEREVMRERSAARPLHVLRKPGDGRPFLIANVRPEALARHYAIWAWVHLALFVGSAGGLGWALGHA